MIEHLSGEQISEWMIGNRSLQMEKHVTGCRECRAQLDELEATLTQFRGAMRNLGGSATPPVWQPPAAAASWLSWSRVALAAAVLMLLAMIPIYWTARDHARATQAEDALLLEHVNSELSRAVPEPMEPLVDLAWNSSSSDEKQRAIRQ
jgi:hypothetical protein